MNTVKEHHLNIQQQNKYAFFFAGYLNEIDFYNFQELLITYSIAIIISDGVIFSSTAHVARFARDQIIISIV